VSRANSRYRRSIYIGVAALGSLVWVSTEQFGIPRESMAWLFVYIIVAALGVIAFAAIVAGLWIQVRKLIKRD